MPLEISLKPSDAKHLNNCFREMTLALLKITNESFVVEIIGQIGTFPDN